MTSESWLQTGPGAIGARWFWPEQPVGPDAMGVLIVPSIVHEEQTTAVGLVALAGELAAAGLPALMIDLGGTAQGWGTLGTEDVGPGWDHDVRAAVRHMRERGLHHIAVVGVRMGALIAAHALADDPVDLMVLWSPVLSGRRFVRELQVLQVSAPAAAVDALPGITVAGFTLPPALVEHLRGLDAAKLDGKPAGRLCVVDSQDRLDALDLDHPLLDPVPVERLVASDTDAWLFTAADTFAAPFADLPRVCRSIAAVAEQLRTTVDTGAGPQTPDLAEHRTQEFQHDGVMIRETFVEFEGLRGILSEPVVPSPGATAMVAVTTVGPGRIFVDLARREAALGRACLRFETAGFGTSARRPDDAWADFYHPTAQYDIARAVDVMVAAGHERVAVVGFCAGAWSAFQMPPRPEVTAIVAVNAQLFIRTRLLHRQYWPGQTASRRVLSRIGQDRRVRQVVKKLERENPVPSPVIRWLGRHVESGCRVTLMFSDDDLGLTYYRRRALRPFGLRAARRRPTVIEYPGLGHLPSGTARERLLADIHDHTV
ncbi:MAG: hypothetical protein U0Q22_09285 [Acidimicrobiales bacterium]